jgi:nucleoside-diphosphate-sugar epimerase
MQILVTGGIGLVGRTTVVRLLRHGHEVHILDRSARDEIEDEVWEKVDGAGYHQVDITDFERLAPYFDGMDAVVHLAAIPHPGGAPEPDLFRINDEGSFNVYRAAADAGIDRVVSASSINALGYNYGIKSFPIRYFPIDEEHPTYTTDPYSFSKQILEAIAAYFWRREGISGVCLRFPAVIDPMSPWIQRMRGFFSHRRAAFETLRAMPTDERRARIDPLLEAAEARRAERLRERPWKEQRRGSRRHREDPSSPPPPERVVMFGRTDFWTLIHVEDVAQAIERGLMATYEGSHPLFVCDRDNALGVPSRLLAEYYFPEVDTWRREVPGTRALVSTARAKALIGFETENSMLTWFEETAEEAAPLPFASSD